LEIAAFTRTHFAKQAARQKAVRVIEARNERLASGSAPLFLPTIRAALLGGYPMARSVLSAMQDGRSRRSRQGRPPELRGD
jgi:hypothetical protein